MRCLGNRMIMNFKYTFTIVLILMMFAFPRGFVVHYQDFVSLGLLTAYAEDGDSGSSGGDGDSGSSGGDGDSGSSGGDGDSGTSGGDGDSGSSSGEGDSTPPPETETPPQAPLVEVPPAPELPPPGENPPPNETTPPIPPVIPPDILCTITAAPTSIATGASSVLSWTTSNAISFSIDQGIGSV